MPKGGAMNKLIIGLAAFVLLAAGGAPGATGTVGTTTGEDISGPCDEAEHANDPRCTGGITTTEDRDDDDRSGPNRGPGRGDDRHGDDDRSGSNRGSDDDRSGDDDNSGSGHGSDDD